MSKKITGASARPGRPRRGAANLLRVAAGALLGTAALGVGTGGLDAAPAGSAVVVLAGALVDVVLAAGLLTLARFTAQRRHLAAAASLLLAAVGVGYAAVALARATLHVSVRLAPSSRVVLDSANLDAALAAVRPFWYPPASTALSLVCLVALLGALARLAPSAVGLLRSGAGRAAAAPSAAGSEPGAAAPSDSPVGGTRVDSGLWRVTRPVAGPVDPHAGRPHTTSLTAVDPWTGSVPRRVGGVPAGSPD